MSDEQPQPQYRDEDVIDRLYQIDRRLEDLRVAFLDAVEILTEVQADVHKLRLGPSKHSMEDVWSLLTSINSRLHHLLHPEDPF